MLYSKMAWGSSFSPNSYLPLKKLQNFGPLKGRCHHDKKSTSYHNSRQASVETMEKLSRAESHKGDIFITNSTLFVIHHPLLSFTKISGFFCMFYFHETYYWISRSIHPVPGYGQSQSWGGAWILPYWNVVLDELSKILRICSKLTTMVDDEIIVTLKMVWHEFPLPFTNFTKDMANIQHHYDTFPIQLAPYRYSKDITLLWRVHHVASSLHHFGKREG